MGLDAQGHGKQPPCFDHTNGALLHFDTPPRMKLAPLMHFVYINRVSGEYHITCVCLLSQLHLSLSSASVQLDQVDCRWKNEIQAVCRQGMSW